KEGRRHLGGTVQFLPRADDIDVIERQPYPILMVLCKVIGSMYAEGCHIGLCDGCFTKQFAAEVPTTFFVDKYATKIHK
ncbi:MAG: hypothetical protein IIY79_03870, partial [Ruminococcus sp.]|nr:hypothetical protein [Ruminococcus sp.]